MIDPRKAAIEDCQTAVAEGEDPRSLRKAPGRLGPDEALINAMGQAWVMAAAGGRDTEEAWERVGLPWCAAYNEAYYVEAERLCIIQEKLSGGERENQEQKT